VSDRRLHAVEGTAEPADGEDLPVLAEIRTLEPSRPAANPAVQAVAVAATGFVAGAATVAIARRRAIRKAMPAAARKRKKAKNKGQELVEVVASRSFLVDIHLLNRD
jgi:hypothetical protein